MIKPIAGEDNGFHTFPKGFSPKVIAVVRSLNSLTSRPQSSVLTTAPRELPPLEFE